MRHLYVIKTIFLIGIFFLFLPSTLFAQTKDNATSIPQFNAAFSKTYDGENNPTHWWKFNAKAGEGVTILITGHFDSSYVHTTLYNESGIAINSGVSYVRDNSTSFFNEAISVTGTYYLKIYGSALGRYDLTIYQAWYNASINDNNRDFYSDFTTARYLSNGNYTRTSPFSGSPLDDVYRVTANAGNTLKITITGKFASEYVHVILYDATYSEIGSLTYVYADEVETLSKDINLSGLYYLRVTGSGVGQYTLSILGGNANTNSDGDALKDAAEYYHTTNPLQSDTDADGMDDYTELTLGKKPAAYSEYNDSQIGKQKLQATPILYRDKKINAEYLNGDHWWKFKAIAEEEITIALTGHFNTSYVHATLYSENGTTLNGGVSYIRDKTQQFISQVIPSSGTYYLKIYGSGYGNYDVILYNDRNHTPLADEERDFYFNLPTARYLSNGNYSRHRKLDKSSPFDQYYYFTANANSTLDIIGVRDIFIHIDQYFYLYHIKRS